MPDVLPLTLSASDIARVWAKVDEPDDDGCRMWNRSLDVNGYGQFRLSTGLPKARTVKAHQVGWWIEHEAFPPGLVPDHVCEHEACVTWQHLEWVTREENRRRAARRAVYCAAELHRWADAGVTMIETNGYRKCRPCRAAHRAERGWR